MPRFICAMLLAAFPAFAHAENAAPNPHELITEDIQNDVFSWLGNPIVTLSIKAQNHDHKDLTQEDIEALDAQWRRETAVAVKPLISSKLTAPLSTYLLRVASDDLGLYKEIFVTDAKGMNVGQSVITSDYWQADEEMFAKTFNVSSDAIYIGDPEWDEKFKIWHSRFSTTITSPETGEAIGIVVIEFNLNELQRRQAAEL